MILKELKFHMAVNTCHLPTCVVTAVACGTLLEGGPHLSRSVSQHLWHHVSQQRHSRTLPTHPSMLNQRAQNKVFSTAPLKSCPENEAG